ncbi:type I DNA topoisomerase [Elusimicrobiota bacterium]
MAKYLVIVESPAKEKTINKFLGKDFLIKSSYGHIRDLPKSKIGIDFKNNFEPVYTIVARSKKIVTELKKYSEKAEYVYLATDYDREGEAIAWHLKYALGLSDEKIKRITFTEITKEALQDAVKHSRKIDRNLVDSQQARRILDRIVGYELSPLLWRKIKYGLSAGRVQSVAVRLICDREEEIDKFKPQEYWNVKAELSKKDDVSNIFISNLISKDGKKLDKFSLKNDESANKVLNDLKNAEYKVASIESKERRRSPYPPYITSTMQQDASRRISFYASKTMKVAQKLYEGKAVGDEGNTGLITYMRTDSLNVAKSAKNETMRYIENELGKQYLPLKPRVYKTKAKGAQEAHEAIRPTSVYRTPKKIEKYLTPDEFKLYDLIWKRFVASQMVEAVYDTMSIDIEAKNYIFRSTGSTIKFTGFMEVYDARTEEDKDSLLPVLEENEILNLIKILPEQHFTEPPPRYNEASLIKALEEQGIGRPSTYASIMYTITDRLYARLEQRRFFPTNRGKVVNNVLKEYFGEIVDVKFTADVEEKLDLVAEGKTNWPEMVKEFYEPFKKELKYAEKNLKRQKVEAQKTDEKCPKCGKIMVLRDSRGGQFLACSGFPECKTTFSIDKDGNKIIRPEPEMTDFKCEKCESPMLKRFGKRGPFLACSAFPKCRNIKKIDENGQPAVKKEVVKKTKTKKKETKKNAKGKRKN